MPRNLPITLRERERRDTPPAITFGPFAQGEGTGWPNTRREIILATGYNAAMSLPEMTPLQFLLVRLLFDGRQSGTRLRERLGTAGVKVTRSAFSQLMDRAEKVR